jgi:RNA polymerase sigma-70 factor (ECF subfamily)
MPGIGRALEHLVLALPPKERASVLLKDVFDYSLEEVAELVGSTVGGVKAALHRGRSKLAEPPEPGAPSPGPSPTDPEIARLLSLYVDRFNRRDWDGLLELISADARILVADRYAGGVAGAPYFHQYELRTGWRVAVGKVDGELAVVVLSLRGETWVPYAIVRVALSEGRVVSITDYTHCPWVLATAQSVVVVDQ